MPGPEAKPRFVRPRSDGVRQNSRMARKRGKRKAAPGDVATNRQARFRYNLLETWECGIVLVGSEVKSLREGAVQLKDAYAAVHDGEVWLHNVHIAPYAPAARDNHDPERPRKLLMHRREIERLVGRTHERGLTLVPTRVYFVGPRAKVEIALARGKDLYDKRRAIKERDQRREVDRALSEAER
jgi:SsrA-binding protein